MFKDTNGDARLDTVETTNAFAKVFPILNPIPYHFVAYTAAADFRWTLTYLGWAGGVIRIAYREQSGSVARPAFANDLTYPAEVGRVSIIRFRNLQMTVTPLADGSMKVLVVHTPSIN